MAMKLSGTHRFSGLELPVYDESTPLAFTPREMLTSAKAGNNFLRAVGMDSPPGCFDSLKELLDKTDEEVQRFAELCEAGTVGHEWGFYPEKAARQHMGMWTWSGIKKCYVDIDIPEEFIVVARVNSISHIRVADEKEVEISHKRERGYIKYRKLSGIRLRDLNSNQFSIGIERNKLPTRRDFLAYLIGKSTLKESEISDYFVDIEPRFSRY